MRVIRHLRTILLGDLEGISATGKVGPGDNQLGAADLLCPEDDRVQVIRMASLPMMYAAENGIGQVDADLIINYGQVMLKSYQVRVRLHTSMYLG